MKKYNWDTEFDTANDLMIHTFNDRVKVVTNIKTGVVKLMRDGNEVDRRDDMPISEYEQFLIRTAESAGNLVQLNK